MTKRGLDVDRRRALRMLGAAVLCGSLVAGCGGGGEAASTGAGATLDPADPTKISVGISVDEPTLMNLYAAMDEGIFKENGLDVTLVASQSGNGAILQSGSIQMLVGPPATITSQLEGAQITAVGRSAVTSHFMFAGPNSGVRSTADLRGKKIGLSAPGGTADLQVHRATELAGIDIDDVTFAYIGAQAGILEAVKTGQVDVGYATKATVRAAEEWGGVEIASRQKGLDANVLSYPIGVNDAWAAENPEVIRAFLKALTEATQLVIDDRAVGEQTLVEHLNFTQAEAALEYDVYASGLDPDLKMPEEYVKRLLDFANAGEENPKDFYTDEYLPKASS
ncbi:ABC transporter substrate-binding protein [Actinophytocola sp.]|uniref:ABC transporter substrate-binding protein n=1 Tax=Actinophytocola sp. TaxID=1872138 RepID=UPI003D6AB7BE